MDEQRLLIVKEGREAMAILAGLRDPQAALLYAFAAARERGCTQEEACRGLELSPEEARRAGELLLVYGLAAHKTLPPAKGEVSYLPEELEHARAADPTFGGICSFFEANSGRILNRRELETLLSVHETLRLPPDVMILLVGECVKRGRLTAREVERLAYHWYDLGLTDYEKAAGYLAQMKERSSRGAKVLALLGIKDRQPGESEQKYIDKWDKMGISDELLRAACDRTLLGAHRLSWPYMDKILTSWHEKGIRTPQQAEGEKRGDRPQEEKQKAESLEAAILRQMQERRQSRAMELENRRKLLRETSADFASNESEMRLCASRMARSSGSEKAQLESAYQNYISRQGEILRELGKPESWLRDVPDCPYCGDRGYIGTRRCQCLVEKLRDKGVTV